MADIWSDAYAFPREKRNPARAGGVLYDRHAGLAFVKTAGV